MIYGSWFPSARLHQSATFKKASQVNQPKTKKPYLKKEKKRKSREKTYWQMGLMFVWDVVSSFHYLDVFVSYNLSLFNVHIIFHMFTL